MAKRYQQHEDGLYLPDWMPGRRPRQPFGPKMFQFTPGCCCPTCVIFADDFSVDDLSTNWTQQSGTWSIGSNILSTSSDNAVLTCNTAYPNGGTFHNHVIEASVKAVNSCRSRILFSYDSGTYNFLEIYWDGTKMYLYIKTSGGTTVTTSTGQDYTAGNWYRFRLCVFDTYITLSWLDQPSVIIFPVTPQVTSTTMTCGLGTGSNSSTTVYFGTFSFEKHQSEDATCKSCLTCSYCLYQKNFQLVISGLKTTDACGDTCHLLNGTWVMEGPQYQQNLGGGDHCIWTHNLGFTVCGYNTLLLYWLGATTCYVDIGDANIPQELGALFYLYGTPSDCSTYSSVSLGPATGPCNTLGATCLVTAL